MKSFKKSDVADIYPLTPMQEGMLFYYRLDRNVPAYFQQALLHVRGTIDIELYEKTLNAIIQKYNILRTVFLFEKVKRPMQVVLKKRETKVYYLDLRGTLETEQEQAVEEFRQNDIKRGFDLQKDILLRVSIFRTGEETWHIIWSSHHILMDGWCLEMIFHDFSEIYGSLLKGEEVTRERAVPYSSYVLWLSRQDRQKGLEFWRQYLDDYNSPAIIPINHMPGSNGTEQEEYSEFDANRFQFDFDPVEADGLNRLAQTCDVTLSMIFRAAWGLLLQRFNYSDDVVFGTVVSGRPPELENVDKIVGLFINTIPVRVKTKEPGEPFSHLLQRLHADAAAAKPYEYFALAEVQGLSSLNRYLINHILVFENYPFETTGENNGQEEPCTEETSDTGFCIEGGTFFERTNYDLNIIVEPDELPSVRFSYNQGVYAPDFIEKVATYLKNILDAVITNPHLPLDRLEMITEDEKSYIVNNLNRDLDTSFPIDKTIHALFEEQVEKTRDRCALAAVEDLKTGPATVSITYGILNQQADAVAQYLKDQGVRPGAIVAIMERRTIAMTAGIMGILKAGAAYLPVSPDFPGERIEYILADSEAGFVLDTEEEAHSSWLIARREEKEKRLIDTIEPSFPKSYELRAASCTSSDLAYVIYTSGTTGRPKGAMIDHRSVVRLIKNDRERFDFRDNDSWTVFHSFCFDFSVWEIFGPLLSGGRTVIIDTLTARNTPAFLETLVRENITVLNQTPSAFYLLSEFEIKKPGNDLKSLRWIIFGGEALNPVLLKPWLSKYPGTKLINMYGITETTVHVTFKEITSREAELGGSYIGGPIPTLSVYIMDRNLRLLPPGALGEIVVGGTGLAWGYLNRPGLTSERFVKNPYTNILKTKDDTLYRSGDLARQTRGGDIEYLGRFDEQVKIRGHRIELKEIETRLATHDNIKAAVVLPCRSGKVKNNRGTGIHLCAYYVPEGIETAPGKPLTELSLQLKEYLAKSLPEYMLPSFFIPLESLPLTSNGKINKSALPPPDMEETQKKIIPPRTALEKQLAETWIEFLLPGSKKQKPLLSVDANFFNIGGHSLNAAQMIADLENRFNIQVPLAEFFRAPTIRALAKYLSSQINSGQQAPGEPVNKTNKKNPVLLVKGEGQRVIFLFHDATGEVDVYMNFCHALTGDISCYGLRLEKETVAPVNTTIQELAGKYSAALMETVKSAGAGVSFSLMGWSLGGLIAFETARQLMHMGIKPGSLVLLDVPPPSPAPAVGQSIEGNTPAFSLSSEKEWLCRDLPALTQETPDNIKNITNAENLDDLWQLTVHHLETAGISAVDLESLLSPEMRALIPNTDKLTTAQFTGYFNAARTLLHAREIYAPPLEPLLNVPVHHVIPSGTAIANHRQWDSFLKNPSRFHRLEGDHFSILKLPAVKMIADIMLDVG